MQSLNVILSWWNRRRKLKLSQSQIGVLLGVGGGTVSRAEDGVDTAINKRYEPLLKELEQLHGGISKHPQVAVLFLAEVMQAGGGASGRAA